MSDREFKNRTDVNEVKKLRLTQFLKIISGDEPEVSHYSLHCERHREAVGDRPEEGIFLLSEIWVAYSTGWRPSIGACRLF